MSAVVVHVEFRGIQTYIFGAGTLLDAIGRSALVESLTDPDAEPLEALLARYPVTLERRAGSFTVIGDDDDTVQSFLGEYSRAVSDISDAVRLVAAVDDPDQGAAAALRAARLNAGASVAGYPLLGGQRATSSPFAADRYREDPDGRRFPISRDTEWAKDRGRAWHRVLQARLDALAPDVALPTRIDLVAPDRGVSSKVAMVVMDVNGLGERLEKLARTGNAAQIADVAGLLRQVNTGLLDQLMKVTAGQVDSAAGILDGTPQRLGLPLATDTDGRHALPVRPLVSGGDDLVLVCESRLGWSIADAAMDYFSTAALPEGDPRQLLRDHPSGLFRNNAGGFALTLGIGIAIVPAGYALLRSHQLAETVCRGVKAWRRSHQFDGHVLGWHFGTTEPDPTRTPYGWSATPAPTILPWPALMALLDPDTVDGIRSTTPTGSHAAWSGKRSWIKGPLRDELRRPNTLAGPLLEEQHLAWGGGIGLPSLDSVHGRQVLRDAVDLLDEHLTFAAPHTPEALPATTAAVTVQPESAQA